MKKGQLQKILDDHKLWLEDKGGKRADLRGADLRGADLRDANLRGANLDYGCWPLWCGSLNVKLDVKQKRQLLYHILAVAPEYRTPELVKEANKFHRIGEVPVIVNED